MKLLVDFGKGVCGLIIVPQIVETSRETATLAIKCPGCAIDIEMALFVALRTVGYDLS